MESSSSSPLPTQSEPLEAFPQRNLEPGDIAVLVLYFLFVLAVGLWVSQGKGGRGRNSSEVIKQSERDTCKNGLNVDPLSGAVLSTCIYVTPMYFAQMSTKKTFLLCPFYR